MLSQLDRRIRAMKGWLYWSLVSMLAAVIIGALVVITSRALAGLMGPAAPGPGPGILAPGVPGIQRGRRAH